MNPEFSYEQNLLSRCALGDEEAIDEFDNRSYLNAVLIAVDEKNRRLPSPLKDAELENVCTVLIGNVYSQFQELPSKRKDLKLRIAAYIPRAFSELIKQRRGAQKK